MSSGHFDLAKKVFRSNQRAFEIALSLEEFRIQAILAGQIGGMEFVRVDRRVKDYASIRDNYESYIGPPTVPVEPNDFFCSATDLLGLRYVTLYNSEVDKVIDALKEIIPNAELSETLSLNDIHDSEKFGYRASHIKYRFHDETLMKLIPDVFLGVEIQVRSALSDAWALHSKKVLHKSDTAPSTALLRQFSRYSAALEELDLSLDGIDGYIDKRTSFDLEVYTNQFIKLLYNLIGESIEGGDADLLLFEIARLKNIDIEKIGDNFINDIEQKIVKAFNDIRKIDFSTIGVTNSIDKIRLALFLKYEEEFKELIPIHKRRVLREKALLQK